MRTHYIGHDKEYQRRKALGHAGWSTADVIADNIARLAQTLEAASVSRSGRALEMGCGAGDFSLWLAEQGYDVSGVDIAPTAVAWAQRKALARGLTADFRVGDVRDLAEFADDSFDLVLDGHCLHCIIGDDRAQFLASARRVLRPGGALVVMTMCGDPVPFSEAPRFDPVSRCTVYGDIVTRYFGRPDDLLAEVAAAGFRVAYSQVQPHETQNDQDVLRVIAVRPA